MNKKKIIIESVNDMELLSTKTVIIKNPDKKPKPKTAYVVVELANHDDYLSGVDVIGVFTDKTKANRVAKGVTILGPSDQYTYRGKVYEVVII